MRFPYINVHGLIDFVAWGGGAAIIAWLATVVLRGKKRPELLRRSAIDTFTACVFCLWFGLLAIDPDIRFEDGSRLWILISMGCGVVLAAGAMISTLRSRAVVSDAGIRREYCLRRPRFAAWGSIVKVQSNDFHLYLRLDDGVTIIIPFDWEHVQRLLDDLHDHGVPFE